MDFELLRTGLAAGLQQLSWLEAFAVFMGITSVYFSTKQHIWVYPTGIVSVLIYVWICFDYGLYADMGINAYYFGMSVYGWYLWTHPQEKQDTLPCHLARWQRLVLYVSYFFYGFPRLSWGIKGIYG